MHYDLTALMIGAGIGASIAQENGVMAFFSVSTAVIFIGARMYEIVYCR